MVSQGEKPKGYLTRTGYRGLVDGRYILFETEGAYVDFLRERKEEHEYV